MLWFVSLLQQIIKIYLLFTDYSKDLTASGSEPGRVCAKSCDGMCASDEVCTEQAEAEPNCTSTCDGK